MARRSNNVLAIVAIVTGILAILTFTSLFFKPWIANTGPLLATAAVICGWLGKRKKNKRTMATVGMILGLVWWGLTIVGIVLNSIAGIFKGILWANF